MSAASRSSSGRRSGGRSERRRFEPAGAAPFLVQNYDSEKSWRRDWLNSGLLIFGLLIVAVLLAQSRRNCEIPGSSWVPGIWGKPLKSYQRAMIDSHFPPPWSVKKIPAGLVVRDATGQSLAYVYYRENDS